MPAPARRGGIDPRRLETASAAAARVVDGWTSAGAPAPPCLAHVDDEVEARRHARTRASDPHQQLAMEEVIAGVGGLARKVELRGQEPLAGRLHLDVIMPGAAGIRPRLDGAEAIAAPLVGEHMTAIAEAAIVIGDAVVRGIGPKDAGIDPKDNIARSG